MRRALFALLVVTACGPGANQPEPDGPLEGDLDGDGYAGAEDCNEADVNVNAGAFEDCNQFDDDCDGMIDEGFDNDADLFTQCAGDCNDNDPDIRPNAVDLCDDGIDADCNPATSGDFDVDADGWSFCEGDCDDGQPLVNPGSVEVAIRTLEDGTTEPELVDNDCDGLVDEANEPCDGGLMPSVVEDYYRAMDMCGPWITSASWHPTGSSLARSIVADYGTVYLPHQGMAMAVLSSGTAADANTPGYVLPQGGTQFMNSTTHPDPQPDPMDGCGSADPSTVNDYVEYTLELAVPANALSFSFDFNFMSVEFPEWVCSSFDDTFIAYLESTAYTGNISFDAAGNPVSVNIGFFNVCDPINGASCVNGADLAGTGYETDGGGTGWLTTTAPVTPNEHITLRFIVFDEGDWQLDSAVLIDNFRWEAVAVDAPVTIPRVRSPRGIR